MSPWVPLDVRYGGPRKRFAWRVKLLRERLALWLAPWLACLVDGGIASEPRSATAKGLFRHADAPPSTEHAADYCYWCGRRECDDPTACEMELEEARRADKQAAGLLPEVPKSWYAPNSVPLEPPPDVCALCWDDWSDDICPQCKR